VFGFEIVTIIANVPALLIGFAFHEYAHAWVADRLGDPTPRSQGRLTLNPFVHLDIFGTLMALFYQFGWAKPVLTQPHYFKGNQSRGRMLVAIAGPVTNLIIAFLGVLLWIFTLSFLHDTAWADTLIIVFKSIVAMNLGLGVFNLLPIPPLDGFKILHWLLPSSFAKTLHTIEAYGMFILLVLLFTNIVEIVLAPVVNWLYVSYVNIALILLKPFVG
jgi:Zn-dependent protease